MSLFDFWWPALTHNSWKLSKQITSLLFKSPASFHPIRPRRRVCHLSRPIRQLAVRWFGCSQRLPFMFNFSSHVPEMDGHCEAQSTTFNSVINQASVHGMNYWLSEFRGNSLFLFSPWWTCFAVVHSVPGWRCIMACLFLFRDKVTDNKLDTRRAYGQIKPLSSLFIWFTRRCQEKTTEPETTDCKSDFKN